LQNNAAIVKIQGELKMENLAFVTLVLIAAFGCLIVYFVLCGVELIRFTHASDVENDEQLATARRKERHSFLPDGNEAQPERAAFESSFKGFMQRRHDTDPHFKRDYATHMYKDGKTEAAWRSFSQAKSVPEEKKSSDDFFISALVAYATNSTLLGYAAGGHFMGAVLGDSLASPQSAASPLPSASDWRYPSSDSNSPSDNDKFSGSSWSAPRESSGASSWSDVDSSSSYSSSSSSSDSSSSSSYSSGDSGSSSSSGSSDY
jgi:uncharacterized membrane protein YgcG